ncbi:MAG: hypothetical protein N2Z79_00480, partial [Candidatus Omnitrophica bacterium]|nr:hypothetical protein [Candidatus Omnitrophota bacterium]
MPLEKLTLKLREALEEAVNLAKKFNHQRLEPEHIFYALFRQREGILLSLFANIGISSFSVIKLLEEELNNFVSVSSTRQEVYFSARTQEAFLNAEREAQNL